MPTVPTHPGIVTTEPLIDPDIPCAPCACVFVCVCVYVCSCEDNVCAYVCAGNMSRIYILLGVCVGFQQNQIVVGATVVF